MNGSPRPQHRPKQLDSERLCQKFFPVHAKIKISYDRVAIEASFRQGQLPDKMVFV